MPDTPVVDLSDPALHRVIEAAVTAVPELNSSKIMLVGAMCRDVLHRRLGHTFTTTATRDLDLALALSSWGPYLSLASAFPAVGHTGVRFRIADVNVDLLPFGDVEDPEGVSEPPTRQDTIRVWAFEEIFASAGQLVLSPDLTIRIPTVAGYAAAKLGAWLDRSEYGQVKDASDIGLILYWYAESMDVETRLYDTALGNAILVDEGLNASASAARLLGADIATVIGPERLDELLRRWPGDLDLLIRELAVRADMATTSEVDRRRRIDAMTRGLTAPTVV